MQDDLNAFADGGFDFAKLAAGMGGEMGDMDMGEAQKMFEEIMKQMGGMEGGMPGMPAGGLPSNDLFGGMMGGLGGGAPSGSSNPADNPFAQACSDMFSELDKIAKEEQ